jgi:hypothetical protein
MKFRSVLLLGALALPASIALADTPSLSDPSSLPKVSCSEFHYSASFLQRYPKAPAACVDGRVYKGVKYAQFNAKVYLASPEFITVELLNVAGDTTSTFSFKPPAGAPVTVNGKVEKFSDLQPGDKITFWVTEKGLSAKSQPASTEHSWRVLPPQPSK